MSEHTTCEPDENGECKTHGAGFDATPTTVNEDQRMVRATYQILAGNMAPKIGSAGAILEIVSKLRGPDHISAKLVAILGPLADELIRAIDKVRELIVVDDQSAS